MYKLVCITDFLKAHKKIIPEVGVCNEIKAIYILILKR